MIISGWEVSRGRSYELDKNSPGSATVTLIDLDGELDPTGTGFSFDPGTPAAIALLNPLTGIETPVFKGFVASLSYDLYQTEDYAVATLELVDGLDRLARMEMYGEEGSFTSWGDLIFETEHLAGDVFFQTDNQVADRINHVLDDAGWPSGAREIFSGNVRVKFVTYAHRTPALTAILDAADAEFPGVANVYIQGNGAANTGKFTFHGRSARFNPNDVQYHIRTWSVGDLSSGADALIFSLKFDHDVNRIINSASATPKDIADANISAQRYENAASISQYGVRSESFDNLLTDYDYFDGSNDLAATRKFAEYYVENYKDPRTRVSTVTFKGMPEGTPMASGTWDLMCGVEISDRILLQTSHMAGGGFNEHFFVEGIRYRKGPHELDVELELDLSPAAYYEINPWA